MSLLKSLSPVAISYCLKAQATAAETKICWSRQEVQESGVTSSPEVPLSQGYLLLERIVFELFKMSNGLHYSKHHNTGAEQKWVVQDVMLFSQSNAITDAIVQSEGLKSMTS